MVWNFNINKLCLFVIFIGNNICSSQNCGVERWNIKTLSDADTAKIDFNQIIYSTVQEQTSIAIPKDKKTFRLASETQVYSINCSIVGYKLEDDKDIHIIIEDEKTDSMMVIEIPSSDCFEIQKTSRFVLFKELNEWFIKNIGTPTNKFVFLKTHLPVTIIGVGFWDKLHGQKGTALSGREIHPVLSIKINQ